MKASRPVMTPIREAAAGEECTMHVAGVCNYRHDTTALAHARWVGNCGAGMKPTDLQAFFACSECNRWTDSPSTSETADREQYESDRNWYAIRAIVRTQHRLIDKGIITVKGIQQ